MSFQKKYFLFIFLLLPFTAYGFVFNTNLSYGSKSTDVLELQKFLNSSADTQIAAVGPGSPGEESTYFGSLTLAAVKKFQLKYFGDILVPAGLSAPNGFVGSLTRAKLNSLSQNTSVSGTQSSISSTVTTATQASSSTNAPQTTSSLTSAVSSADITNPTVQANLSNGIVTFEDLFHKAPTDSPVSITHSAPTSGGVGSTITLTGVGFTATNTIYSAIGVLKDVPSANGTIIFKINDFPQIQSYKGPPASLLNLPIYFRVKSNKGFSTTFGYFVFNGS